MTGDKRPIDIADGYGVCGETQEKWDNGVYISGFLNGLSIDFLIDSGSTSNIISSKTYELLPENSKPELARSDLVLQGVQLQTLGIAAFEITFKDQKEQQTAIICDIELPAILGQDFLIRNVDRIDYRKMEMKVGNSLLPCWVNGEAEAVCAVHVTEFTTIPPLTGKLVSVSIPNLDHLSPIGLIDRNGILRSQIMVTPGLRNVCKKNPVIQILTISSEEVKIQPNPRLTTCESVYLNSYQTSQCYAVTTKDEPDLLPPYLHELHTKSSVNLSSDEKSKLAELLIQFQDIFSKSSDDLGRTDQVLHRINTGTAHPIRQPIGKREAEREEVEKMLERGVIEPSCSPWCSNVVLVRKKDHTYRFCVDYRSLNEVTVQDA